MTFHSSSNVEKLQKSVQIGTIWLLRQHFRTPFYLTNFTTERPFGAGFAQAWFRTVLVVRRLSLEFLSLNSEWLLQFTFFSFLTFKVECRTKSMTKSGTPRSPACMGTHSWLNEQTRATAQTLLFIELKHRLCDRLWLDVNKHLRLCIRRGNQRAARLIVLFWFLNT